MRKITSKELRKEWIDFYVERGHKDCGAVSLVSDGSTGAMFNVAGMQPIMPYLLGKKHPLGTRLCNVQGCVRTNDIDGVGDKSHLTFFEMMGSWSLGDYFKEDRCKWSYELLTQVFQFDRDHLAATVFEGDDNAPRDEEGAKFRIASGFKKENVFYLPAEDNWWGLEYGPCGPDSEMFFIADVPDCGPNCRPGCHCGKYTEVGNDVFMQYEKHQDGTLTPLEKKNVDTGWGLERNLAFLNGLDDVYKTDLFAPIIACIEEVSGVKYESDEKLTKSMRVIADHLRTAVMLIGDEAKLLPSNNGPGYVLRRLIRRAVRNGRSMSLKVADYRKIASIFIDDIYNDSYPLLVENREFILSELEKEIKLFETTIENGLKEYRKIVDAKKSEKASVIDGKSAFRLYDTFGFPLELTVEMAEEEGLKVDEEAFKKCMEEAKALARDNANFSQKTSSTVFDGLDEKIVTEYVGYEKIRCEATVVAISSGDCLVDSLPKGSAGVVVTDVTSFYATMGGQKGDRGSINIGNVKAFLVDEAVKIPGGRVGHVGVCENGIKVGDKVTMEVCPEAHAATCRNHTATHLLQAALQEVLGKDVHQQGSYQDAERTRFDFSFGRAMNPDQIKQVEDIVNKKIAEDIAVVTNVMSIEEAKKTGAMALFGEKYGEEVRVVSIGDFSKELCGGTHVKTTADIRLFKILSESGVAAGVRRIEAITADNVMEYYQNMEDELKEIASMVKSTPSALKDRLKSMMTQIKELNSELESLKSKMAKEALGDVMDNVVEVKGVKLLAATVPGVDMNGLRELGDQMKARLQEGVVVLISEVGGKVNMVAMATDGAIAKGAHAGNLIKKIAGLVGGGGGGKPNSAQAGGSNPSGIKDAINESVKVLETQLN